MADSSKDLQLRELKDMITDLKQMIKTLQATVDAANKREEALIQERDNLKDEIALLRKKGANEAKNRFRKDEVKVFNNIEGLLQNAPEQDRHMFKIPKVLN